MIKAKKIISLVLAVLCFCSAFAVNSFAAVKKKSYNGKYGKVIPVQEDYKTTCKSYSANGVTVKIPFAFKSKGYEKNVYFNVSVYSDKEKKNKIFEVEQSFPVKNLNATLSLDFSKDDSGVYYGQCYTYRVSGDDEIIDSDTIKSFTVKINKVGNATTEIIGANAYTTGNSIEWKSVKYADGYYVYRKQAGEGWKKLDETEDCSYFDETAVIGEEYFYTVRAYDTNNSYKSDYNKDGVSLMFIKPVQFDGDGEILPDGHIKLKWFPIDNADTYRIYRKSEDGKYKRLAIVDADVTEFVDKTEKENGETYSYKVRAYNGTNAGLVSQRLDVEMFGSFTPSVHCDGNIVDITWDEVEGADYYSLFKKKGNGEWLPLVSGSLLTQYSDEYIEKGEKYSYTLVVEKNGRVSSYDSKGVSVYCLEEPKITSAGSTIKDSVLIKWGKVSGAKSYNVYRKAEGGEYQLVGNTKLTSFYDTTDKKSNLKYTYYVEAVGQDSVSQSGNNTKTHLYMTAPELVSVKWDGDGNALEWKRVAGATSYRIYRKAPDGSYKKIADTTKNLFYVDTTAKKGGKYYYTVRAMNGKVSGAYESGIGVNCLDIPEITSIKNDKAGNTKIVWGKISGADGYYVYRKTEGGSWKKLTKTTSLSYTDKSQRKNGEKYIYTVKAYNKKGTSLYDKVGEAIVYKK